MIGKNQMPKIFICTANQFRSPLAAAYFSSKLQSENTPGTWDISSAGTWSNNDQPAHSKAIELGEEFNLDLRSHKTREISSEILAGMDLIFVMEQGHKEALCFEFPHWCEKILLLSEISGSYAADISDPVANNFDDARLIAYEIIKTIDDNFVKIVDLSFLKAKTGCSGPGSSLSPFQKLLSAS